MRSVYRASAPDPNNLNNLSAVVLAHLSNYKRIDSAVYGHNDVKNSLKILYFDKCYICEGDVSAGFDVEHYLPKKNFPSLGYTWSNLHKVCGGCNLAKERKEFLIYDASDRVVDVNLLDPSSVNYKVEDYVEFNINSCAQIRAVGSDPAIVSKAQNTVLYLNGQFPSQYGKELKFLRSNSANRFLKFCIDSNLSGLRDRIREINIDLINYIAPNEKKQKDIDQRICELLINVDDFYLSSSAPFSSSTRVHIYPALKITYQDMVAMKNKLRGIFGM